MSNLQEQVNVLENQITKMQGTLRSIMDSLDADKKDSVDLEALEKKAASNRLSSHPCTGADGEVVYRYCTVLAMLAGQNEDQGGYMRQLYFILRVYHSACQEMTAEKLLRDAKLVTADDLVFLKENLKEGLVLSFFVDALLMLNLTETQDRQFDIFAEIVAFFGLSKEKVQCAVGVAKAILEMKEEELYKLSCQCDVNSWIPLFGGKIVHSVVPRMSDIPSAANDCVIVYGDKILDIDKVIDLDAYSKREIIFRNCIFENVIGIINRKCKLVFTSCRFSNCRFSNSSRNTRRENDNKKPTYFLDVRNASLSDTVFENCALLKYGQDSSVFRFKSSSLERCQFIDCRLSVSTYNNATGALANAENTKMVDCTASKCSVYGEGDYGRYDYAYMHVMRFQNGRVEGNIFENCSADSKTEWDGRKYNYILAYNEGCRETKNKFEGCRATQEWNYGRSKGSEPKAEIEK